jgi:tRNA G10  N-methylase Trm11
MKEYLIRLVQVHESFRKAEIEALAEVTGVTVEIMKYLEDVGSKVLFKTLSSDHISLPFV